MNIPICNILLHFRTRAICRLFKPSAFVLAWLISVRNFHHILLRSFEVDGVVRAFTSPLEPNHAQGNHSYEHDDGEGERAERSNTSCREGIDLLNRNEYVLFATHDITLGKSRWREEGRAASVDVITTGVTPLESVVNPKGSESSRESGNARQARVERKVDEIMCPVLIACLERIVVVHLQDDYRGIVDDSTETSGSDGVVDGICSVRLKREMKGL